MTRYIALITLALLLFASHYQTTPTLEDDSSAYLDLSERMSVSACFFESDTHSGNVTLYEYIIKKHLDNICAFGMSRPLMYPLLLRLFGVNGVNLLQNMVYAIAGTVLCVVAYRMPTCNVLRRLMVGGLVVLCMVGLDTRWHNHILTESLNLSGWMLLISAVIALVTIPLGRSSRYSLYTFVVMIALFLAFLRDGNTFLLIIYAVVLYCANMMIFRKFGKPILPSLLIVAVCVWNYGLIHHSERYLHTYSNQIIYHLGHMDWESPINGVTDADWFDRHYDVPQKPSARWASIDEPFIAWTIENAHAVWTHYVVAHILDFLRLTWLYFAHFHGLLSLFIVWLFLSGLYQVYRLKLNGGLIVTGLLYAIVFGDLFLALVGDFPGEIFRHSQLSFNMYRLLIVLSLGLTTFGKDSQRV